MMHNSKSVDGQIDIHPNLYDAIEKHLVTPFQRQIQAYNIDAFNIMLNRLDAFDALVFDTGCGTGDGARLLAEENPQALVVGTDQSSVRLSKKREQEYENLLLLHCDLIDFWRLCFIHKIRPNKHFLLYPNPWPKKKHYQRRWPAHAILPYILGVGGELELRTNWITYAQEMAATLNHPQIASYHQSETVEVETFTPKQFLTRFEEKYAKSGQSLYKVRAKISQFTCPALDASLHASLLDAHK